MVVAALLYGILWFQWYLTTRFTAVAAVSGGSVVMDALLGGGTAA